jgi:hypothetical protein
MLRIRISFLCLCYDQCTHEFLMRMLSIRIPYEGAQLTHEFLSRMLIVSIPSLWRCSAYASVPYAESTQNEHLKNGKTYSYPQCTH